MSSRLFDVWNWQGRIGRARYLATGLFLLAIKHNLDRILAASYGYPWSIFNYWIFRTPDGIDSVSAQDARFYAELVIIALPFLWVGTVLTLRRLRDADLPLWLAALFFFPFLNLALFFLLSVIPSREASDKPQSGLSRRINRLIPRGEFGSAMFGVLSTAIFAVLVALLIEAGLGNYGWGLFIGLPFFLGLNSVLIYGYHEQRSVNRCLLVSILATGLAGALLLALAIEGVICLAMAFPIASALALLGGLLGYGLQRRRPVDSLRLRVVSVVFLLMPGLTLLEYTYATQPTVYPLTTTVVIKAKPDIVWKHVVSFAELPKPGEAIFKTGIAYPIRAEIEGRGVGAVRHCQFSTGPFVEPITVWDEPRLLRFDVTSQPRVMDEWSFYNDIRPPHLEHYLISKQGQFELKALPDGSTLLEGTTWYSNRMWPGSYWRLWSDHIIHRIHQRVLNHIKTLAEAEANQPD